QRAYAPARLKHSVVVRVKESARPATQVFVSAVYHSVLNAYGPSIHDERVICLPLKVQVDIPILTSRNVEHVAANGFA
ncbi:hypothetical protein, partial [Salmonella sp. ZJJH19_0027]|uniref:hypothetical protein n=1 Tax=Salmonella sp. ZJJH19_0027 TaxID=3159616 RepID=UPI0039818FD1